MDSHLSELLEQAKSGDAGERYEAVEELCAMAVNQGTPGPGGVDIINGFCEIVRAGHQTWPDIIEILLGFAVDLVGGPAREGKENRDRTLLLNALIAKRFVFAATLSWPCEVVGPLCTKHNNVVELLRITGPHDDSFTEGALALVRRDPLSHAPIQGILQQAGRVGPAD